MDRPLTAAQSEGFDAAFKDVLAVVARAQKDAGLECKRSEYDNLVRREYGEVQPEGTAVTLEGNFHCTSDSSVRVTFAVGRETRNFRVKGSLVEKTDDLLLLSEEHGALLLVGRVSTAPKNVPPFDVGRPAISIRFDSDQTEVAKKFREKLEVTKLTRTLAGIHLVPPPATPPPEVARAWTNAEREAAERAVVTTILERVFGKRSLMAFSEGEEHTRYRIGDRRADFLKLAPDLRASVFEDYDRMMADPTLPPLPKYGKVVPYSVAEHLFDESKSVEEGWRAFAKLYPGSPGRVSVSRVGFSADGQQAMVYVGYQRGGLDGGGYAYILGASGGVWTLLYEIRLWFS